VRIPAPKDFEPSVERVILRLSRVAPGVSLRVSVDPEDRIYEICEENNTVERRAP